MHQITWRNFYTWQDAQTATKGKQLNDILTHDNTTLPYGVIRGKVKELETPIESSSGLNCVLQNVTIKEHSCRRYAFGHW